MVNWPLFRLFVTMIVTSLGAGHILAQVVFFDGPTWPSLVVTLSSACLLFWQSYTYKE